MEFPSKPGCPMCSIVNMATLQIPSSSLDTDATHSPVFAPSPYSNSSVPASPTFPANASSSSVYLPTVTQSPPPMSPSSPLPPSFRPLQQNAAGARRLGKGKESDPPEIVYRDANFTVYRERTNPVSSRAHFIFVFNLHVPSLYMLSSSDVPLLNSLRSIAHRLLSEASTTSTSSSASRTFSTSSSSSSSTPPSSPPQVPTSPAPLASSSSFGLASPTTLSPENTSQFRVGFITPPWKDNQIPVKDHLHAHAYIAPADLLGWWRKVAYSPLAWYAIEDLIAEIREESTNNRIRSFTPSEPVPTTTSTSTSTSDSSGGRGSQDAATPAYVNASKPRPIDRVPDAGARSGTASGVETTVEGISGLTDLESGRRFSGYLEPGTASSRRGSGLGSGYASGSGSAGRRKSGGMGLGLGVGAGGVGPVPPRPARLASPSHLDLSSAVALTYMSSGNSNCSSGPSSPTTPTITVNTATSIVSPTVVSAGGMRGTSGSGFGSRSSGSGGAGGDVGVSGLSRRGVGVEREGVVSPAFHVMDLSSESASASGDSRRESWFGAHDAKAALLPPTSS